VGRARSPALPLIAVDYPSDSAQATAARARAAELGFHVSHQATGDGALERLSRDTRVLRRAVEP